MPNDDPFQHPRFQEWVAECRIISEVSRHLKDPTIKPPPFSFWLQDKLAQESQPIRRIRGDNPPAGYLKRAERLESRRLSILGVSMFFLFASMIALALMIHLNIDVALVTLLFVGIIAIIFFAFKWIKTLTEEAAWNRQRLELDAFSTEFTAPLADRSSIIRITVHFQIPLTLNPHISGSTDRPAPPSRFVEQLNRVAEVKLITYTQRFDAPPSAGEIEEYLNRELVQFQDENAVPILRVAVPFTIPVPPSDKPKGVNV
jgi:hypothetical protein